MPEPPKITTSLADRIARLNATQKSLDRNHATEKKEIGEIKSKISKYEASGQYEAPLIPRGSFGLGAPLTKPERGLDRIRIASLGVSGGMTVYNSIKSDPSLRSVSLGRRQSIGLSSPPVDLSPQEPQSTTTITPPSSSANRAHSLSRSQNHSTGLGSPSSLIINEPTTPENHQPSDLDQPHSEDSSQVYDGILDGYPTTPADEESPPMVTCSKCLKSVELELLAEHLCQLSVNSHEVDGPDHDASMDESRDQFPVDVPESPVDGSVDNHKQESQSPFKPTSEPSTTAQSTNQQVLPSSSSGKSEVTQTSSKLMIHEGESEGKEQTLVDKLNKDEDTSIEQVNQKNQIEEKRAFNRSSDSSASNSTNSTNRMSGSNRPDFGGPSPIYRNWHDDDDDDDYADQNGTTGFVTIVRSSSRI